MHAEQNQGGGMNVGRCRCIYRVLGDTLMTHDHTAVQVSSSGYGRAGIGRSSWKGDATKRLRFFVIAACWYTPWCSANAVMAWTVVSDV